MDRGKDGMPAQHFARYPAPAGSAKSARRAGMTGEGISGQGLRPASSAFAIARGPWTATEPALRDTGSAPRRRRTASPGRDTARGSSPVTAVPRNV